MREEELGVWAIRQCTASYYTQKIYKNLNSYNISDLRSTRTWKMQ